MAGARQRRAVIEGSLLPTGKADLEPIGAGGGKGKGEKNCTGSGGGMVRVFRLEGNKERRRPGDVTGRRRGGGGR